jgi:hypothetical protein
MDNSASVLTVCLRRYLQDWPGYVLSLPELPSIRLTGQKSILNFTPQAA